MLPAPRRGQTVGGDAGWGGACPSLDASAGRGRGRARRASRDHREAQREAAPAPTCLRSGGALRPPERSGGAVCELTRLLRTPQERARGRRSPARSRHALLVASLEPSGRHGGQRVARPPPSDPNTGLPASTTASAEQQFPRSPAGRPHGIINCGSPVQQHVLSASDLRARRLRSRTASRAGLMVQKQLSVPLITGQRDAAPTGASSGVEHGLPLPGPQDGPPADAQWWKGSGP